MISTKNSFSYENISIKFSMYQVHTKSIKVCKISNMVQYEEEEEKPTIYCYITKIGDAQKSRPYSTFKGI